MFQNETRLNESVSSCYRPTPGFHCLPYLFAPINCFFSGTVSCQRPTMAACLGGRKKANLLIMIESQGGLRILAL